MKYANMLAGAAAAVALALAISTTGTYAQAHAVAIASAMPSAPPVTPPSAAPAPPNSDRRLAAQLPVVDRIADILQHARDDYNGDRARAITALNHTREDLRSALKADNQAEPSNQNIPNTPVESAAGSENGTMAASNERLQDARTMINQVIDNLRQDGHDYGGFRLKAIADLEQARDDITDALLQVNGGGAGASDRSLAATASLTERSIDELQHARMDYDGHRVAAIDALNKARSDLANAMKADNQHEDVMHPVPGASPQGTGGTDDMSQAASNAHLRNARGMIDQAIQNLKADNHDFGGFRVKAIADLQQAESEIDKALAPAM